MGTDWPALETVEELFGSLEAATLAAGFDYASRRTGERTARLRR